MRVEETKFQSTGEICIDGWLLEGDKINVTGSSLMGDSEEITRLQMSLDAAIYADRSL